MPPHRSVARVAKGGTVTVTGVPAAEGDEVDVIVVPRSKPLSGAADDASKYTARPVETGEFSSGEDPLAWDAEGWDGIK